MGWIAFAALDVYLGLIILEALIPSLPAERLSGAKRAQATLAPLAVPAIDFVAMVVKPGSSALNAFDFVKEF